MHTIIVIAIAVTEFALSSAAQRSCLRPPGKAGDSRLPGRWFSSRCTSSPPYSTHKPRFAMPRVKKETTPAVITMTPPQATAPAPYPPRAPQKMTLPQARVHPIYELSRPESTREADARRAAPDNPTPPVPQIPLAFRAVPGSANVQVPPRDPFVYTRIRVIDSTTQQSDAFYYRHHISDATADMFWTLARAMSGTVVHRFFFLAIACGVSVTTLFAKFANDQVQELAKLHGPKLGGPVCAVQPVSPTELGSIQLREDDRTIPTLTFRKTTHAAMQ